MVINFNLHAQELNCSVVVSAEKIVETDPKVFKTLEGAINEFMNQTVWTKKTWEYHERIECSVVLTLTEKTGNNSYSGSIQVQSSRPIYNSIYTSPVLNYKDDDLTFSYTEFEPLQFDINSYQSELISTLSFFAYLIIGLDADTFALNGGDDYFNTCQNIVDQVDIPNSKKAWKSNTNKFNRYHLVNKLITPSFDEYRRVLYNYHLNGLDKMADNEAESKNTIKSNLLELPKISQISMASQIIRTFMDAKADEIVAIFSGGTKMETTNLVATLNLLSPTNNNKWEEITKNE
jgi:hypothetical protein